MLSLHCLLLSATPEKWISGKPKYGQATMRCATDESSLRLPHSLALHVCNSERERKQSETASDKRKKSIAKAV